MDSTSLPVAAVTAVAVSSISSNKKTATHSHIRGLGLREDGIAEHISSGFVGQSKAREVILCVKYYVFLFKIYSFYRLLV